MLNNYDYLLSKCPWWLKKNNNVQAFYKSVSKLFDEVDKIYNLLEKQNLVDHATGEFLDDLGIKFSISRNGQTDERYRNRVKLAMIKYKLVPNLETISNIGKIFTGLNPEIKLNTKNEPALYDIKFIGGTNYDFTLIDDLNLNEIVGGGVKINVQKYVDSYTPLDRFKKRTFGVMKIKNEYKRNPIKV